MYPIRGRGPAPERGRDSIREGDSDGPGEAAGEKREILGVTMFFN